MTVARDPFRVAWPLFPDPLDRAAAESLLTKALENCTERVKRGRVSAAGDLSTFRQDLESFDFVSPVPLPEVLAWTMDRLEHGIVHVTHPSYFGLFNPAPSFPAQCAERIVAAFNPQLASSTTSPVPVEMEAHVIRALAVRAGLPACSRGHFTTGGSEANYTALLCALTTANAGFAADGARAYDGQPVCYVSDDAHLAWFKIAHQAGIGRSALHVIACDNAGRMSAQALASAIASDKARGRKPVMIVGTAGTTSAGMIDPLAECARLAKAEGIWFHADAAWGGALLVSDRLRGELAGLELADSVTIDAHKWLATTMACGMFITPHEGVLSETFHVTASFMPSNVAGDPYCSSVQWSRRFLGLRLFVALAVAGWAGYAEHVERASALTDLLARELKVRGWSIVNASSMAVLCVEPPPGYPDARTIARSVVASGLAWISSTTFRGREAVRICLTNGQTSTREVLDLADLLESFRPSPTRGNPDN